MKKFLSNIWYHYKSYIIIFGAVVAIGIFLIINFFSKVEPDLQVIVFTETAIFDVDITTIEAELKKQIEDINNDGKIEVSVKNIFYAEGASTSVEEQLTVEMYYGKSTLILCNKDGARKLLNYGAAIVDLSDTFEKTTYDGRGYLINTESLIDAKLYATPVQMLVFVRNSNTVPEGQFDATIDLIRDLPPAE